MPADLPFPSETEVYRPASHRPLRAALGVVALMFVGALATAQVELLAGTRLSLDESLLAYLGVQAAVLGLVVAAARLERRPLRDYGFVLRGSLAVSLLFAVFLVMLFVVIQIYPGFLFGFGRAPPQTVLSFGFALLSAPLIAVSQEAMFRGYIFRTLSRAMSLGGAMAVSAGLFGVETTNLAAFGSLGVVAGGQYLFGTTVTNFVLGLLLALYYYKARWSLAGPVAARTGMLWAVALLPVAANFPNWADGFAASLLTYGVLLAVVLVGLREPRLQAQRYLGEAIGPRKLRFRERARNRREMRRTVVTVGAMAVVFVAATQVAPLALGTSPPLVAIATGSMVPTLHRGTMVVLEHAPAASIHVGTIIAFHVSCLPAPTVHRVYRIVQGGSSPVYLTKGDANPSPDPCNVPYADVIGRVVAIVPYLGFLILEPLLDGALVALIIVGAMVFPRRER